MSYRDGYRIAVFTAMPCHKAWTCRSNPVWRDTRNKNKDIIRIPDLTEAEARTERDGSVERIVGENSSARAYERRV